MKRFFSIIIFIAGNFFLYSSFFMIGGMSGFSIGDLIVGVILMVLGGGLAVAGALLWGWGRRKMTFGVSAATIGGVLLFVSISLFRLSRSEPDLFSSVSLTKVFFLGIALTFCGVLLIIRQLKVDKKAKSK